MSEYLPSFIVEPVLRQARRFSRLSSSAEDSPRFLPAVPDLQRWTPSRFWNSSPPPSLEDPADPDTESKETTVQSITRTIQLWASQLNAFDQIPSPPLEPMLDGLILEESHPANEEPLATTEFPPLSQEVATRSRPAPLETLRTASDTSLNPADELPYRSRVHAGHTRPHSMSDSIAAARVDGARPPESAVRRDEQDAGGPGPRRPDDGSGLLPEDDGMGLARKKISDIWSGPGTPAEKSRRVHELMMERYQKGLTLKTFASRPLSRPRRAGSTHSTLTAVSSEVNYNLNQEDLRPTYAPADPEYLDSTGDSTGHIPKPVLGCVHYKRNVKMQCSTCERWYTCRLCHDEAENHTLPRRETQHMLCMLCNTPQTVGQICKNCQAQAACYYCAVCKLWNNDPEKSIYHCDDCGICRLGEGLGKDFFHCQTCAACMSIQAESTHKCIEKSTKSDCPICGEYMFTSNKPVAFMRCGHSIHEACFAEWCNASYKCPICSKSIANMESQFRRLDRHIEEQPMPEEYRDNRSYIFCNDCNSRSITKYHWLGLKCTLCESYNTTQLELLGAKETARLQEQQAQAQQLGVSEAALTASQSHTPLGEGAQPIDISRELTVALPVSSGDVEPEAHTPRSRSSWLMPHSPSVQSTRSLSPAVGNYFGTGQSSSGTPTGDPRPWEDDQDLDFWGRPSTPRPEEGGLTDSGSESDSDVDEAMEEDDDGDEVDEMDIFGHR